jgi:anti-sigma factor RsiW
MRALLSDFLDHSLHWRTARSLEAHLAACPPCAVFVASVERTIVLYRERPVVDVPPAVRGHLRELLRERHEAAPKKRAGRCCAGAALAREPGKPSARSAAKKPSGKR